MARKAMHLWSYVVLAIFAVGLIASYLAPVYWFEYAAHRIGLTRATVADAEILMGVDWIPQLTGSQESRSFVTGKDRPSIVLSKLDTQRNRVLERILVYKDEWPTDNGRAVTSTAPDPERTYPWGKVVIIHDPSQPGHSMTPDDWIIVGVEGHRLLLMVKRYEALSEIEDIRYSMPNK